MAGTNPDRQIKKMAAARTGGTGATGELYADTTRTLGGAGQGNAGIGGGQTQGATMNRYPGGTDPQAGTLTQAADRGGVTMGRWPGGTDPQAGTLTQAADRGGVTMGRWPGGTDPLSGTPGNVTYVDDDGERQTGIADTTQPGYYDSMRQYYEDAYNSQVAGNNEALANARTRAQEAANAQLEALTAGYQSTNKQLYRDYMNNRKTLPQQMAALGYTGGLTESSRLRLGNAYEEALAENERERLAQAAGINENLSQRLYEAQATADAANRQAAQDRYGQLASLLSAEHQETLAQAQERAATLAQSGDFSGYLALGYTQDQVDAMAQNWQRNNVLEERAATLAASGDFSGYLALGYTPEQVETMEAAYRKGDQEKLAALLAQAGDYSGYAGLYGMSADQQARLEGEYSRADREQQAAVLATAGDFSGYLALGYTQDQVDALTRAWLAQNPTLQDAWTKAHPEDAKRLGLVGSTGSGGVYSGVSLPPAAPVGSETQESCEQYEDISYDRVAADQYSNGKPLKDVMDEIEADYQAGNIDMNTRNSARQAVEDRAQNYTVLRDTDTEQKGFWRNLWDSIVDFWTTDIEVQQ